MTTMHFLLSFGLSAGLIFVFLRRSRVVKSDVSSLPGPVSRSWLYGNMIELMLELPGGKATSSWLRKYGSMIKFYSCFGEEELLTTDATAIKHIFANPSIFGKSPGHQLINLPLFGRAGLPYAEGEVHRRIRTISNPMFSSSNIRSMAPIFREVAQNMVDVLSSKSGAVMDVNQPIRLTTLEAITKAAIGYETDLPAEYSWAHDDLLASMAPRSKSGILSSYILSRLPETITRLFLHHPAFSRIHHHLKMTRKMSKELLERNREIKISGGTVTRNMFNILVDVNDRATKSMTAAELHDQLGTLTIAGQDTTTASFSWIFYVLATNPKWQEAIRREINEASSNNHLDELDYDRLPSLNAFIKEVLRFYPAIPFLERVTNEDTVIPLSREIVTGTGRCLKDIRVEKGKTLVLSVIDYNRLTSIWGEDAHEFNPARWLNTSDTGARESIGPYASLLSFSGGTHVCIGWRFALLEMQIITSEILKHFTILLPENVTIYPAISVSLLPVDSQEKRWLPLRFVPLN